LIVGVRDPNQKIGSVGVVTETRRLEMKKLIHLAILGVALLIGGVSAFAHHAFSAEFDVDKKVTLTGTIAKMEWVNPHSWLWIDATGADGKVDQWGFEFGPPNALFRRGWTKSSVQPGAKVTVTAYLAKDGRKIASADQVTLADGRTLFAGTAGNGAPGDPDQK
jgi:hypothetical protein